MSIFVLYLFYFNFNSVKKKLNFIIKMFKAKNLASKKHQNLKYAKNVYDTQKRYKEIQKKKD